MIIEPSLDISASLSLSSVFAREVSNPALSSFVFYVGAIIPNWKESGTVCFLYLSARFVGTARSVNKIAGKEGRKKDRVRCWLIEIFSSYQLSLSLSIYFSRREIGGSLFQPRVEKKFPGATNFIARGRIEKWRDS